VGARSSTAVPAMVSLSTDFGVEVSAVDFVVGVQF